MIWKFEFLYTNPQPATVAELFLLKVKCVKFKNIYLQTFLKVKYVKFKNIYLLIFNIILITVLISVYNHLK